MANLIIKSSADNLVLQGSDASPAITVGATGTLTFAENVTMSGTANNLGTTTAGTLSSGVTFPAGHVIQTVSTSLKDDSTSAMPDHGTAASPASYDTWSEIISGAITPHKANSKILINFNVRFGLSNTDHHTIILVQQISSTYTRINNANADGNHMLGFMSGAIRSQHNDDGYALTTVSDSYLDNPSSSGSYSSGAITYSVRIARYTTGGTIYINRTAENRNDAQGYDGHSTSNITLMEIAT